MRDTRGQLAQRIHPLAFVIHPLRPLASGHVEEDGRLALPVDAGALNLDLACVTVLPQAAELVPYRFGPAVEPEIDLLPHQLPVVRMDQLRDRGQPNHLIHTIPEDLGESGIHILESIVSDDVDARQALLDQGPVSTLVPLDPACQLLTIGDVGYEAFDGLDPAIGRWDTHALLPYPPFAAVRRTDPIRDAEPAVVVQRSLDGRPYAFAVIGMDELPIRHHSIADQVAGIEAGQAHGARADEVHGPVRVVGTAIRHAREVPQQPIQEPIGHGTSLGRVGLGGLSRLRLHGERLCP